MPPFDPDFDDARWTLDWADVRILQVPVGSHPDGFVVIERELARAQIFDRMFEAREPFPVRALIDPFLAAQQGKLKLKRGELAQLSRWYKAFQRAFLLWQTIPIQ